MAKEKRRLIEEKEQQVTMFYYEIIGSFSIIFSITTLGKLGKIGNIFTIFFKVAFGDWYWIFILFILFFGIYSLFMHNKFNFKSHRFIGFIFILICILSYSHFPIHNYITSNNKYDNSSYFMQTWQLYRSFINGGSITTLGGGLVGSIVFYLFYYLLGSIGVILLGIIIFILGLSLMFNKTLEEIFKIIKNTFNKILKSFKSFNNFFRYEVGKDLTNYNDGNSKIIIRNKKIPLKLLDSFDNNNTKSKINRDTSKIAEIIRDILITSHYNYLEKERIISYYVTTYKYTIINNYNFDYISLFTKIKNEINKINRSEILFSIKNNEIIIQVANIDKMILSLKELILINNKEQTYNLIENIPIGISYNNNLINIKEYENILIIGDYYVGIKNFINSLIILSLINKNYNQVLFNLYDELDNFKNINFLFHHKSNDIYSFLDEIRILIDNRYDILKKYNLSSYENYLKEYEQNKIDEVIPFIYIIIDEIVNEEVNIKTIENKIMYIAKLSRRLGLKLIYVVRKDKFINNIIYSIFDHKIVFKTNKQLVNRINNNKNDYYQMIENSLYLEANGDAFYANNNDYIRFITPLVSKIEKERIKEYFVK